MERWRMACMVPATCNSSTAMSKPRFTLKNKNTKTKTKIIFR
jgi:hypothetical protein